MTCGHYIAGKTTTGRRALVQADLKILACLSFTLLAYTSTSFVFWLPGIPVTVVAGLKAALACVSVALSLVISHRVGGMKWLFAPVALLAFSAVGLLQSSAAGWQDQLAQTVLPFLFLFAGVVFVQAGGDANRFVSRIVIAAAGLCAFGIVCASWGVQQGEASARASGFGFTRTGWSNGLAFAAAAALAFAVVKSGKARWGYFACFTLILGSQAFVGGRAGIVCSILAVLLCAIVFRTCGPTRRFAWLLVAVAAVSVVAIQYWDQFDALMRISRTGGRYQDPLDAFSSGRLATYRIAWMLIEQRPIYGYGFDHFSQSGYWGETAVHNVWLKLAYQGGLLLVAAWLVFVLAIVVTGIRRDRATAAHPPLAPILTAGFLLTFFEPNVLVGTFQASAPWWLAAGFAGAKLAPAWRTSATETLPSN